MKKTINVPDMYDEKVNWYARLNGFTYTNVITLALKQFFDGLHAREKFEEQFMKLMEEPEIIELAKKQFAIEENKNNK